jgi:hypothetical protein
MVSVKTIIEARESATKQKRCAELLRSKGFIVMTLARRILVDYFFTLSDEVASAAFYLSSCGWKLPHMDFEKRSVL